MLTALNSVRGSVESDKQRAREAARIDGSPRLRAMLDAEPVKPKGKKRPR